MTKRSLSKHRFIIKLILTLLVLSFTISTISGVTDNYLLMSIQALSYAIFIIPFGIIDYGMSKWENFPDYYKEYGFVKLSSLIDFGITIPSILYIPLFIAAMFYILPENYKPDLLPVVLTNVLVSLTALYSRSFIFHGNMSSNEKLYNTINKWLSKLFYLSFFYLLLHASLIYLKDNFLSNYTFIIHIVAVVFSVIIITYDSIERFKTSTREIINDNVSEGIRFEFLSFIAENIEYFCEFKNFRIRKLKDHYKAEINVVLPSEYTLDVLHELERRMNEKAIELDNKWIIKLYSKPCNNDCIKDGEKHCPVKRIYLEK